MARRVPPRLSGNLPKTAAVALALLMGCSVLSAAKTDKIDLKNGDVITGEIKELTQGSLRYSTDSMSTVFIDWVDVVRVTSTQRFQVEVRNGDLYFGELQPSDTDFTLVVAIGEFRKEIPNEDVVRINPIKEGFWAELDGSLSLGFQYTQANQLLQTTLSASVQRRRRKYVSKIDLRLAFSTSSDEPTSKNNSLGFLHDRFLGRRWAAGGALAFQQNDELGIALRTLVAGTATRGLVQSRRQRVTLAGGLDYNREDTVDGETDNSAEVIVRFAWAIFKVKSPKTDLSYALDVFPGITDWGRLRIDTNISLRQELVKDFFWNLSGWYTSDNRPPGGALATRDYGVSNSLGWTF